MEFMVWADVCRRLGSNFPVEIAPALPGDNIYQPECDILLTEGTPPTEPQTWALADSENQNVFTGQVEPLVGSNDYYIGVGWRLPDEVGNVVQTDAYVADISFYTEQFRNNPDFICNAPEARVSTGEGWGLAANLNNENAWTVVGRWGNNGLSGDYEQAIRVPNPAPVYAQDDYVWGTEPVDFTLEVQAGTVYWTIDGQQISAGSMPASSGTLVIVAKAYTAGQSVEVSNLELNGSPLSTNSVSASGNVKNWLQVDSSELTADFTLTGSAVLLNGTGGDKPAFEIYVQH
jgi:hypothetical protein